MPCLVRCVVLLLDTVQVGLLMLLVNYLSDVVMPLGESVFSNSLNFPTYNHILLPLIYEGKQSSFWQDTATQG